ncbi:hypothetical protein BG261_10540 [Floricoccus tropicus]|uniref:Aminoglycoside phosphotransferase domain-containing protein n=1 Tax=Floricoccus tropicus TaxID=1859473 RepID=A0A1E8GPB9_9LACT|nr:phosphotransferase family protein [Floricoccus tropicus]OFI50072.1 hypothetical protein BG261_10540 [Floricoccus tropicus]
MLQSDENWQLTPVKGSTGNTFYGTLGSQQAFIKRNATPLLAAVAREEIAPKLLWSRRTRTGDTLSAQEWINGGVLTSAEMTDNQINIVLGKLHRSRNLVDTFMKMGNLAFGPTELLNDCYQDSHENIEKNSFLKNIFDKMRDDIPPFDVRESVVVHGDVNHKNWIRSNTQKIYLVDWETAMLADPLVDVSHILSHYIDPRNWNTWLVYSGYKLRPELLKSILWYGQLSFFRQIALYFKEDDIYRVNREIYGLRKFCEAFENI